MSLHPFPPKYVKRTTLWIVAVRERPGHTGDDRTATATSHQTFSLDSVWLAPRQAGLRCMVLGRCNAPLPPEVRRAVIGPPTPKRVRKGNVPSSAILKSELAPRRWQSVLGQEAVYELDSTTDVRPAHTKSAHQYPILAAGAKNATCGSLCGTLASPSFLAREAAGLTMSGALCGTANQMPNSQEVLQEVMQARTITELKSAARDYERRESGCSPSGKESNAKAYCTSFEWGVRVKDGKRSSRFQATVSKLIMDGEITGATRPRSRGYSDLLRVSTNTRVTEQSVDTTDLGLFSDMIAHLDVDKEEERTRNEDSNTRLQNPLEKQDHVWIIAVRSPPTSGAELLSRAEQKRASRSTASQHGEVLDGRVKSNTATAESPGWSLLSAHPSLQPALDAADEHWSGHFQSTYGAAQRAEEHYGFARFSIRVRGAKGKSARRAKSGRKHEGSAASIHFGQKEDRTPADRVGPEIRVERMRVASRAERISI